jgi:hypothetical protein
MSTLNFLGTLELFQKLTGRTSPAVFHLSFSRDEEFCQISCLQVFLIDAHIQQHGIGPAVDR